MLRLFRNIGCEYERMDACFHDDCEVLLSAGKKAITDNNGWIMHRSGSDAWILQCFSKVMQVVRYFWMKS